MKVSTRMQIRSASQAGRIQDPLSLSATQWRMKMLCHNIKVQYSPDTTEKRKGSSYARVNLNVSLNRKIFSVFSSVDF